MPPRTTRPDAAADVDTAPDSELRSAAIDALHEFSLTRAEDAIVRRSESEIPAGAF
jgi:hypothetical protein